MSVVWPRVFLIHQTDSSVVCQSLSPEGLRFLSRRLYSLTKGNLNLYFLPFLLNSEKFWFSVLFVCLSFRWSHQKRRSTRILWCIKGRRRLEWDGPYLVWKGLIDESLPYTVFFTILTRLNERYSKSLRSKMTTCFCSQVSITLVLFRFLLDQYPLPSGFTRENRFIISFFRELDEDVVVSRWPSRVKNFSRSA